MEENEKEIGLNQKSGHSLNWKDCVLALLGIGLTFALATILTIGLAGRWDDESILLYFNGFVTQVLFFAVILIIKISRKWSWADLGYRSVEMRQIWGKILGLYALTWVINLIYVFYLLSSGYTPPETDTYSQLLGQRDWILVVLNIILAGLLAPFIEETLFRGVIYQGLLSHFGPWTAAILSSAFFAGIHFQAYGFIPRFALALMLTYLVKRYHSLYPAIALHALNNMIAVILGSWMI